MALKIEKHPIRTAIGSAFAALKAQIYLLSRVLGFRGCPGLGLEMSAFRSSSPLA
jgi:hypothetical protein